MTTVQIGEIERKKVYILACGQNVQYPLQSGSMKRDFNDNVRLNLLRIMDELQLNQTQFAKRVGVDPKYINKIVNEDRNAGKEVIERIAKALNMSFEEIVKGPGKPEPNSYLEKIKNLFSEAERLHSGDVIKEKVAEYATLLVEDVKNKGGYGETLAKAQEAKKSIERFRSGKPAAVPEKHTKKKVS